MSFTDRDLQASADLCTYILLSWVAEKATKLSSTPISSRTMLACILLWYRATQSGLAYTNRDVFVDSLSLTGCYRSTKRLRTWHNESVNGVFVYWRTDLADDAASEAQPQCL